MINEKDFNEIEIIANRLVNGNNSEKAVASILNAVMGACYGGNEMLLCTRINRIVVDELLPQANAEIANEKASQN